MRVTYGGLQLLRKEVPQEDDDQTVELPSGEEPWGPPRRWRNIHKHTKQATQFLAHMGLVRVMSGFEDFLANVYIEHQRFAAVSTKQEPVFVEEDVDELRALFARLSWNLDELSSLLPLFDYFTLTRNCIVHRDGRASPALVERAVGSPLQGSIARWNHSSTNPLPSLPTLELNRDIHLLPRHAALASIVCNRIAYGINQRLLTSLGELGLIHMAAWHTLLAPDIRLIFPGRCGSPEKLLKRALIERYRAEDIDADDLPRAMTEIGKWSMYHRRFFASPYWAEHVKKRHR